MNITKTERNTEQNKKMVEFLDKQLERTNYWLSFAEAKNGALLAINVAIMAVSVSLFESAPIICTITVICFILSSGVCLKSFFPNNNSRPRERQECEGKQKGELNLLYYGDIAGVSSSSEYIELCGARYFPEEEFIMDEKMIFDLASEVLINSRITIEKYNVFKLAVKIDFVSLLMTVLFFIAA